MGSFSIGGVYLFLK